ncbi:MAG: aminopeptidase [Clostridia bacterium]|nr:aminopeptidase [Clostridia bacterium]
MVDERIKKLAHGLVNYSVKLKENEKILISINGLDGLDLGREIIKEVYKVKGKPFVRISDENITNTLIKDGDKEIFNIMRDEELEQMKKMDAYIAVRAAENITNAINISSEQMELYEKEYMNDVLNERVDNTKWVILRYPNASMAQLASMNTEEFEDFYFNVCNLDYAKMDKAMDALKELISRTDKVHIVGPGTDLSFSIKGMGAIKCAGECNIPDGEVYTAPIKDSVNGKISYNAVSTYRNTTFSDIVLEFKEGKIINATSNNTKKLNEILDTDEGARYIGEFALGVNPYVTKPMNDILFDEKIAGSFHFTPGRAYQDMFNGNISAIHWDLVCIQTEEKGGGEIYFDDVLIRKNGRFVLPELESLNPENLM